MKHVSGITKNVPSKACVEDHPGLIDSITGFLADPTGAIDTHLEYLTDKVTGDKEEA